MNYIRKNKLRTKRLALASLLFFCAPLSGALAQQWADTTARPANVLIEEFTAVHCFFCPAGHALLDSLINEHPGRVFGTAMHPDNTSYTAPYAGSPDFRRPYVDAFFSNPFATDTLRFFPGAFINRRQWQPNRREQDKQNWRPFTDSILSRSSPLNIGLNHMVDMTGFILFVDLEVYYTDTATFPQTLYVYLIEDSVVAEQNNGGVNYIHNHLFRESLCAQWGDTLISTGLPGALYTTSYIFNNSITGYNLTQCHLLAFVRNAVTEEIVNVQSCKIENFITAIPPVASETPEFSVFPNPFTTSFTLEGKLGDAQQIEYVLYDVWGRILTKGSVLMDHQESKSWHFNFPDIAPCSVYILELHTSEGMTFLRLLSR